MLIASSKRGLIAFAALIMSMSAASQTADDGAKLSHALPLLINGGGFQSILMVTNVADQANRCTLESMGNRLDASSFETHENLTWQGNSATLELPNPGTRVRISGRNTTPSEVYDSAVLDCDSPAVVQIMVTLLSANGAVEAAAVLPGAQMGAIFKAPVLPQFGDYLFAAQNRQADEVSCRIELLDESGVVVGESSHDFAGSTAVVSYLGELVQAPADFGGGSATVSCDSQIAATGLLAGAAWSGLPPAVLSSARAATGFAPDTAAAFDQFVVGKRFVNVDDSRAYVEFPSAGQFVEIGPGPGERYTGTYSYGNTGPDTGTLTLNYSDGDICTNRITLTSLTTASSQFTCSDGETGLGNWRLEDSQSSTGGDGETGATNPPQAEPDERAALVALYHATDGSNWENNTNWLTDAPLQKWFGVYASPSGRVDALYLNNNNLSGTIPSEVGELTQLRILELDHNALSGSIPPELGNLANLELLRLSVNELSGPIPPELGNLASLRWLLLGFNSLSGPVPPELGKLSQLETLSLWVNSLTGPIPAELGKLTELRILRLLDNMLVGEIPPALGNLANLENLGLGANSLSGAIPSELANLPKLKELYVPAGVCVSADLLAWAVEFRVSAFKCDLGQRVLPSVLMREDSNGLSLALPDDLRQSPTVSVSDSSVVAVSAADGWLGLAPRGVGTAELQLTPAGGGESAVLRIVVRAPVGAFGIDIVMDRPAPVTYEEALMRGADWWSSVLDGTEWPDRDSHCHNDRARGLADELLIHASIFQDLDTAIGGYADVCNRNDRLSAFDPGGGAVVAASHAATPFLIRHEIGHLLGLTLWGPESELVIEGEGIFYFTGPRAVKAFRERGGDSALPGVPFDGAHWQFGVVKDFMGGGSNDGTISAAALADMGFTVNLEKAAVPPDW